MNMLDPKNCYQALKTHDARFDGRFFVGVTSTGIYCRPICAVKTPKPENCRFFPTAAVAESHGFRPCLRCRPELAPGQSRFDRGGHLAKKAACLIEDGFLDENDLVALAEQFNVTDRHLRRVFQTEFGVSLVGYAQTHRLLLAKRLLTDTMMPITDVAMASGFSSVRRFNDSFKERYRLKPSDLRKAGAQDRRKDVFQFDLGYRPPYNREAILGFLAARTIAGVELVEDGHYIRAVVVKSKDGIHTGWIDVSFRPDKAVVQALVSSSLSRVIPVVLTKVKRIFDLSCDPAPIATALASLKGASGLRVPGAFDGFEMAVRAILGQQVSVKAAQTLAGRIATRFGSKVETPHPRVHHIFPNASVLANCASEDLRGLGITGARVLSIIGLAKALDSKKIALNPNADVETTMAALKDLPGIGEWTAQYIAMRALAWPDAFPHTDLGIKKAMGGKDFKSVLKAAEPWKPWRAYAVMSLWQSLSHEK